jgi:hypothetical protein
MVRHPTLKAKAVEGKSYWITWRHGSLKYFGRVKAPDHPIFTIPNGNPWKTNKPSFRILALRGKAGYRGSVSPRDCDLSGSREPSSPGRTVPQTPE